MSSLPPCPKCQSEYAYEDRGQLVCPDCAHEWQVTAEASPTGEAARIVRDANGTALQDGDSVIIVKDLPVKGAPRPLKAGTKVKKIKLVDGDHDIDCRIEGYGAMQLKSQFVRKA